MDADEILKELLDNELVFMASRGLAKRFPPITTVFKSPWTIHTASLVLSEEVGEHLSCLEAIRLRCLKIVCNDRLALLRGHLDSLVDMSLSYLSFVVPDQESAIELDALIEGHPLSTRVSEKIIDGNEEPRSGTDGQSGGSTAQTRSEMSVKHFNRIVFSLDVHREASSYNTFYNARIHVTADGGVRYSEDDPTDLIQLKELHRLMSTINNKNDVLRLFPLWGVTKEQIDVCKDCELRMVCMDARRPVRRFDGEWFHTVECTYNPYICKWKGEEGYRSLAECGVVSNVDGFSIDHERIAAINAELWGE